MHNRVLFLSLIAVLIFLNPEAAADLPGRKLLSPFIKTKAPIASVDVVNVYPHDAEAFTQGLFFHDGRLYESTGRYGKSGLFLKDLKTGKILREITIARDYFGEGAVRLKDKIYQLTWQNETLFIYDARSFQEIGQIKYSGEGWGLTTNGRHLLMSNGSSTLTFRDPETFKIMREITVRDQDMVILGLNELEYVRGEIWANIFMTDWVVRISPKNGKVKGWIDMSKLRSYLPRHAQVDVINGIAYDDKSNRIFVTGKLWPKLFEIRLVK
jgi:glutamine cyclotransferase